MYPLYNYKTGQMYIIWCMVVSVFLSYVFNMFLMKEKYKKYVEHTFSVGNKY